MNEVLRVALDGSSSRCARCGWLDASTERTCAQCGATRAPGAELTVQTAPVAFAHHTPSPLHVAASEWAAALDRVRAGPRSVPLEPRVRETLARHHARCVVLSERSEEFVRHVGSVAEALRGRRGSILIHCVGSSDALRSVGDPPRERSDLPSLCVTDRALSLSAKERRVFEGAAYALVCEPDPLRDGLTSLHAVLSLARPELASTRRSFLARFGRVAAGVPAHDHAALGALLTEGVLLLDARASERGPLALIHRWMDAAPRG